MGQVKRYTTADLTTIPPIRDAFFEYSREYSNWGSDYSITELLRPPQEVQLVKRYREEIDARPFDHDRIEKLKKAFRGSAIHNSLDFNLRKHIRRYPNKGYMMEQRVWDKIHDRFVSGKFDCWLNKALYDFKTCSVWKAIFGSWDDFVAQLNMYDYLLSTRGIEVAILYIIAWYQDWIKEKQWSDPDYPKTDIELIHVTGRWGRKEQKDFLHHRVALMVKNEDLVDDQLDLCTDSDMWAKPDGYAVMRPGQKKAVAAKGLDTKAKAQAYIDKTKVKDKDQLYIEYRPGVRMKCEEYCKAAPYCFQFKEYCAKREAAANGE